MNDNLQGSAYQTARRKREEENNHVAFLAGYSLRAVEVYARDNGLLESTVAARVGEFLLAEGSRSFNHLSSRRLQQPDAAAGTESLRPLALAVGASGETLNGVNGAPPAAGRLRAPSLRVPCSLCDKELSASGGLKHFLGKAKGHGLSRAAAKRQFKKLFGRPKRRRGRG